MTRHRFDPTALVAGLLFIGIAVLALVLSPDNFAALTRWFWPATLLVLGLALLLGPRRLDLVTSHGRVRRAPESDLAPDPFVESHASFDDDALWEETIVPHWDTQEFQRQMERDREEWARAEEAALAAADDEPELAGDEAAPGAVDSGREHGPGDEVGPESGEDGEVEEPGRGHDG